MSKNGWTWAIDSSIQATPVDLSTSTYGDGSFGTRKNIRTSARESLLGRNAVRHWSVHSWEMSVHRKEEAAISSSAPRQTIITSAPMEIVAIDYLHLERSSAGCEYIMVITDHFTRYTQAYATRNKSSHTAAKHLYNDFILRFGVPKHLKIICLPISRKYPE